jgi:AraC family transcriptional regulator of adaptative response/methylated-DNA-[protein]-cysteine methyltransferase
MKIVSHAVARASRGKNLTLVWGVHPFPTGKILVAISAEGLCWLGMNCGPEALKKNWPGAEFVEDAKLTEKAAKEIARLWPRKLEQLKTPIVLYGTPFQLKVWKELLKIGSGSTVTYESIARKVGSPKAVRAVGSAVGKNPVAVVVPCHRVVNKTGGKINFGWGPALKTALLKGEKAA